MAKTPSFRSVIRDIYPNGDKEGEGGMRQRARLSGLIDKYIPRASQCLYFSLSMHGPPAEVCLFQFTSGMHKSCKVHLCPLRSVQPAQNEVPVYKLSLVFHSLAVFMLWSGHLGYIWLYPVKHPVAFHPAGCTFDKHTQHSPENSKIVRQ